jgi:hypothetical protein
VRFPALVQLTAVKRENQTSEQLTFLVLMDCASPDQMITNTYDLSGLLTETFRWEITPIPECSVFQIAGNLISISK